MQLKTLQHRNLQAEMTLWRILPNIYGRENTNSTQNFQKYRKTRNISQLI